MPIPDQPIFGALLEAGEGNLSFQEPYSSEEAMGFTTNRQQHVEVTDSGPYAMDWRPVCTTTVETPDQASGGAIRATKSFDAANDRETISFMNPFYGTGNYEEQVSVYRLPNVASCNHEDDVEESVDQVYEEWNAFASSAPNQFLCNPSGHSHPLLDNVYQDIDAQITRRFSLAAPTGLSYELPLPGGHLSSGQPSLQFVIENPSGKENIREEQQNSSELPTRRHSMGVPHLYCCPWTGCSKVFNRFYNLRSHYRIHSGEKPFTCNYCEASFARNHDLKRHVRIHLKTKPYQCPVCSKAFSRNDAMNRHVRLNSCSRSSVQ